jgi:orotidine-5'-phosphate decarboxylase
MSFADRLDAAVRRAGNPCLLGIDPHLELLPEPFACARDAALARGERARALGDFCCELVELAAGRVAAVKPQSAFFELFGADGAAQWERVVRCARDAGLLVIGDVKRGDISSTAAAYAQAFLEGLPGASAARCDAITVNPFLGRDSLEPFAAAARRADAGLYVLLRTSNPGGRELQSHGDPPLYERVADMVRDLGSELRGACGLSSIGAVVGATLPEELARLRGRLPSTPFLLPGYGAQGAGAAEIRAGFLPEDGGRGRGALVNSSRGVAFAWKSGPFAGRPWKDAARLALDAMVADVARALRLSL